MRCKACDVELTDNESKAKDRLTGDYMDLCSCCSDESNAALYDYDDEGGDLDLLANL